MIVFSKRRYLIPMAFLSTVMALTACGGGGEDVSPLVAPGEEATLAQDEPVVITIGNLTDITGPSANALTLINMALDDIVEYYNSENLIPGVKLKVITYDGQMDPSRDIPGYEWLKERGADLIFTAAPDTPLTLKSIVNEEKMPLFAASGQVEQSDSPGYIFFMGVIPEHEAYTVLNWIAENDWDYESKGPARIGAASWTESYSQSFIGAMEEYVKAHSDQFEWAGGYLTNFTFTWGPEVEALKDCDYVYPCLAPVAFVKKYRSVNDTAKFIGSDPHTALFSMINGADIWDEIDGSLFIRGGSPWWNEEGELIDLNKRLLYENHPDEAEDIMKTGNAYAALSGVFYPMLEIIADAVEAVGAENFDSQALYEAAESYSLVIDGVERASFTETRRYAYTNYLIYRASAADKDIIRADENWIPCRIEP